jgi:hypothetical protein
MRTQKFTLLFAMLVALTAATAICAQDETFSAPNVDYSFSLPDVKWKLTVKPSDTSPNVEYVYGDRNNGHLEVRKLVTRKDLLTSEAIQDEEQKLQFLPGYVAGKEENFAGRYRGVIFNYEFVRAGRPMLGRIYFLRIDDTTIYAIRFSGMRDMMKSIQHQTDSIARTFVVKKPQ